MGPARLVAGPALSGLLLAGGASGGTALPFRAPDNQALVYFLADALLTWEPSRREEACSLLQRCVASKPRSDWLVEDAHYAEQARERLAELR